MKTFFLLAAVLTSQAALANMKECREFSKDVLESAVTEDAKATDQPYRMNKDEKKALSYIEKFDIKKLGLQLNKDARNTIIKDCNAVTNANPREVFCNNTFNIFNYFRAMTHGMQHNKWSAKTIATGKSQAKVYIEEVVRTESSLLDTIIALNVLEGMAKAKLVAELDQKAITKTLADIENFNLDLKKSFELKTPPMTCKDFQEMAAKEMKGNAEFVKKLKTLSAPLSKT